MSNRVALALICLVAAGSMGQSCNADWVAIAGPSGSITTAQTVTLTAQPAEWIGPSAIQRIEFYREGQLACVDVTAPYQCPWTVTAADNGVHSWHLTSYVDNSGSESPAESAPVELTVAIGGGTGGAPELVGFVPGVGSAKKVAVDTSLNRAYVASEDFGLSVLDVSDPGNPSVLSAATAPFAGFHVAFDGPRAVVTGGEGLKVLDVSNSWAPEEIGSCLVCGSGTVAMSGDFAYVRHTLFGRTDLVVVDLRAPGNPQVVAEVPFSGGTGMALVGSYAYVAAGSSLQIVDVSNPFSPRVVGSNPVSPAKLVAVADGYAYVGSTDGVTVVDVRNPTNPVVRATLDASAIALGAGGGRLYVRAVGEQLEIFDVTNPAAPALRSVMPGVDGSGLTVVGDLAFVAAGLSGLEILEVSPQGIPTSIGSLSGGAVRGGVAYGGSHAVVTGNGLEVLDVSDPTSPEVVGSCLTCGSGAVAASGDFAFVRQTLFGRKDLNVVDLRTPWNPQLVAQVPFSGGAGLDMAGSHVYVADGSSLQIVDVSNPFSPQVVGSRAVSLAKLVTVADGYAYVGSTAGVSVVDVRNPTNPVVRATLDASAIALEAGGGHLYVRIVGEQLQIFDVTNPAAPALRSTTPGMDVLGMSLLGDRLYLGSVLAGTVHVLDVSNPAAPVETDEVRIPAGGRALAVESNMLYASDDAGVIDVIQLPLAP